MPVRWLEKYERTLELIGTVNYREAARAELRHRKRLCVLVLQDRA